MIALALAAMLLAAPATEAKPAPAPADFDRACRDEYGRDLCDEAVRADIRRRFGVEPAEALAGRGVEGVRVFMVDGYSRDMPLISVLWADETAAPVLETRVLTRDSFRVMTAPANRWTVESVGTLMRLTLTSEERVGRYGPPAADGSPPPPVLCLHAWVSITEVLDAGRVHRRIRTACGDDAVFDGGYLLSTTALNGQDGCWALDASLYRNDSTRLVACASLMGDTPYDAAEIHNRLSGRVFARPGETALDDLSAMMAPDLTVRWPDQPASQGPTAVASAWHKRTQNPGRARLWIQSATASKQGVTVTGLLSEQRGEDESVEAAFSQTWTKDKRYIWRLTDWTIQPFAKRR